MWRNNRPFASDDVSYHVANAMWIVKLAQGLGATPSTSSFGGSIVGCHPLCEMSKLLIVKLVGEVGAAPAMQLYESC